MNSQRIDALNIVLIVVSLIVAIQLPFKLFVFSYAILGPLHYLTEINWLNQKNFFIRPTKKWSWIFLAFALISSIYPLYELFSLPMNESFANFLISNASGITLAAFIFAISLVFLKDWKWILLSFILSIALAVLLKSVSPEYVVIFGLFVPTLIHVYIFTLLFMIYGALKSPKKKFGIAASLSLALVPFVIAFVPVDILSFMHVPESDASVFFAEEMAGVSRRVASLFGGLHDGEFRFLSDIGIRIQIFIAFAYTYHYLNWFSKTSVIGWKKSLSAKSTLIILVIWAAAIGIYLHDIETGFLALFFLSFLHVLMEFPLNVVTIREIGRALKPGK